MTSREEIQKEASRIGESVELSSVQHFIAAKVWRNAHMVLGLFATMAATISTALTFYSGQRLWPGLLALLVAIVVGLITFLNSKHQADLHHGKGIDYQQLATRGRILERIEAGVVESEKELLIQLRELSERKFKVDRQSPATPGGIFYRLAKRSIARGETNFRASAD